jgi:gamma-glutamylcyclotransferase (GGCT)/AIG2-like uncharacterized protein YtfP
MLYFAYGANLDPRGMKRRCPQAVALGPATLHSYRLEFRTFLTIEAHPASLVRGVLFQLTPSCLRALDAYEGADYEQITVEVETPDGPREAMAYVMTGGERAPPSIAYFTALARGYAAWNLDAGILRKARIALLHPKARSLVIKS